MKTFSWSGVFREAGKFPALRVAHWKNYKRMASNAQNTLAFLNKAGKEGGFAEFTFSRDLIYATTRLSVEASPLFLFEQLCSWRPPDVACLFTWKYEDMVSSYDAMGLPQVPLSIEDKSGHPATIVTSNAAGKTIQFYAYDTDVKKLFVFPPCITINGNPRSDSIPMKRHMTMATLAEWAFGSRIGRGNPEAAAVMADPRLQVWLSGPIAATAIATKEEQLLYVGTGGNLRWLAALAAIMNRPSTVIQGPAPYISNEPRPVRQPKAREAYVLTTLLPAERIVHQILKLAERGERKKPGEHDVDPYWAHRRRGAHAIDPACNGGYHDWPDDGMRRQFCRLCGGLRWRLEASKRGAGAVLRARAGKRLDYRGGALPGPVPGPTGGASGEGG